MTKRRYPGVSPFTRNQKKIFFGRTEDIKNLKKLILLREQVLLYSKSGIGKTSLLNAGVLPKIDEKFIPIPIRFTAYNQNAYTPPIENIILKIILVLKEKYNFDLSEIEIPELAQLFENNEIQKGLWYYFKKIQLSEKIDKKFILIFDQFEELFSYPEKYVNEFKKQFAELRRTSIPDNIIEQINLQIKNIDKQDELIDDISDKISIKSVFAIRSDRLSELNKLTDKMPDIQEVFYELKPLGKKQIIEAVTLPARETDKNYISEKFNFNTKAIEKIITELQDKRSNEIETTQLQIVCQQIEDIAIEKQKKTLQKQTIEIEVKDLPEFEAIFLNFYETSISKLSADKQKLAKRLIEDEMIRNNVRISLDEEVCKLKIDNQALKILVDTHLLRADRNNFGRFSYEISHDTLVLPIAEARKKYLEKEKFLRIENEKLKIEKEKAEKERIERIEREKRNKRQRQIIFIVSVAAVISIAFGIFGFVNMIKAQKSEKKAVNSRIMGIQRDAQGHFDQERYKLAIEKYYILIETYKEYPKRNYDYEAVDKKIIKCKKQDSISKIFYENIEILDSLQSNSEKMLDIDNDNLIYRIDSLLEQTKNLNYKSKTSEMKFEEQQNKFKQYLELKIDKYNEFYTKLKNTYPEHANIILQKFEKIKKLLEN